MDYFRLYGVKCEDDERRVNPSEEGNVVLLLECPERDSNKSPPDYKSVALRHELTPPPPFHRPILWY
jgi:hypothetical protein